MKFKMNNEEWQIIETSQEKMCEEDIEELKNILKKVKSEGIENYENNKI